MRGRKRDTRTSAAIMKTYSGGATLTELQKKYGIRSKGQLASAVLDALIATGKMPPLARGKRQREAPKEFAVSVNKRGTIVLHKEAVVGSFRFKEGQSFKARRRGKKIILTAAG